MLLRLWLAVFGFHSQLLLDCQFQEARSKQDLFFRYSRYGTELLPPPRLWCGLSR